MGTGETPDGASQVAQSRAGPSRTTVGVLLRLGLVTLIGNAGGAAVVTGFALYLAPTVLSADEYRELQRHSVPALVVFTVSALVFGGWWVFLASVCPDRAMARRRPCADGV